MKKQIIAPIISLFFLLPYLASAQEELLRAQKIDSLLSYLHQQDKVMGTVTITENGKEIFNKSYGFAKIVDTEKRAANPATKYRIGSISKMFTATMIFQLIEEEKLSLETRLDKFFPQIANASKISIQHLLSHQSGLHDFTNDEEYFTYYTSPKSQSDMLALFSDLTPDFEPGEKSEYSNTNYVLLGFIIERLSQNSYANELKARLVDKIGLQSTKYGTGAAIEDNEAFSYTYSNNAWKEEAETNMTIPHGAGAIVSTTQDLTRFIEALFKGQLINDTSLEQMTTLTNGYGMGVFQYPFYDRRAFGHNGGIDGFVSHLSYFPEEELVLAFCSNAIQYNMNDVLIGILSLYFGQPYDFPEFKPAIMLSQEQLMQYEGTFSSAQLPLEITFTKEDHQLMGQATNQPPLLLEAKSETTFTFDKAGIEIEFLKDEQERFNSFILKQGGGSFTFTRKEEQ